MRLVTSLAWRPGERRGATCRTEVALRGVRHGAGIDPITWDHRGRRPDRAATCTRIRRLWAPRVVTAPFAAISRARSSSRPSSRLRGSLAGRARLGRSPSSENSARNVARWSDSFIRLATLAAPLFDPSSSTTSALRARAERVAFADPRYQRALRPSSRMTSFACKPWASPSSSAAETASARSTSGVSQPERQSAPRRSSSSARETTSADVRRALRSHLVATTPGTEKRRARRAQPAVAVWDRRDHHASTRDPTTSSDRTASALQSERALRSLRDHRRSRSGVERRGRGGCQQHLGRSAHPRRPGRGARASPTSGRT